jgi:hypothetical protein
MKRWTIDHDAGGKPIRLVYNGRPPAAQVPGMPWCDELVIRTPGVVQHARIGHEGFDELVRLVELDERKLDVLRLAVDHARDAMLAEGVPNGAVERIIFRMVTGVPADLPRNSGWLDEVLDRG